MKKCAYLVIKPTIGASSRDQFVLTEPLPPRLLTELQRRYDSRSFFVQPFLANVQTDGEYSLFFLGGEYSHAILKTPEMGDFRSQEEHGAEIKSVTSSPELIAAAWEILELVQPQPVYARVDMVRDDNGVFRLMELELIEPSLYLRTDPESCGRFARAFDQAVIAR